MSEQRRREDAQWKAREAIRQAGNIERNDGISYEAALTQAITEALLHQVSSPATVQSAVEPCQHKAYTRHSSGKQVCWKCRATRDPGGEWCPATVQPQPVLERYHIEPSGKMWVEHPPFKEPAPQPAQTAGEKCRALAVVHASRLLCDHHNELYDAIGAGGLEVLNARTLIAEAFLKFAGEAQQPQPAVGAGETAAEAVAEQILKGVPLHLVSGNEFAEQALFDAIVKALQQPCPRCADLELMLNRRENYYTNCCNEREALTKERDTLQAKVTELEKALREIGDEFPHVGHHGGVDDYDDMSRSEMMQRAKHVAQIANAALGEKEAG